MGSSSSDPLPPCIDWPPSSIEAEDPIVIVVYEIIDWCPTVDYIGNA